MTLQQEVGLALRAVRQARGMSQADLSKATGIPQSHVCNIEAGKVNPTIKTLNRLAEALKTSVKIRMEDKP